MKTEKDVSNHLMAKLPAFGFHIESLQFAKVNSLPDLLLAHPTIGTFLIEVKAVDDYKDAPDIRKGQPQWIEDHCKAGGKVVFVVLIRKTNHLMVYRAANVRVMMGKTLIQWEDYRLVGASPVILKGDLSNADVAFATTSYSKTRPLPMAASVSAPPAPLAVVGKRHGARR